MQIVMPDNVKVIMDTLQAQGYQAFVYGACIRDTLLGLKPISWDICTNALPPDIIILFDDCNGFSAVPQVHDYSTVQLIYQGENYKVNSFRADEANRFAEDVREELAHSDFTMNALAYNEQDGLLDIYNGVNDVSQKIIRCIGNPAANLQEDPVRILRAVRFESQLGFTMDQALLDLIISMQDRVQFDNTEKLCNEITQILLTEKPSISIRRLLELGLLQQLIPELIPTVNFDTRSTYHDKNVFDHTMAVLDQCKPNLALRLAALFHDIDKPNCLTIDEKGEGHCYGHAAGSAQTAREVLSRLNFDRKTINSVCALIKEHMNDYLSVSELSLKRLIRRVGPNNLDNLFELQLADIKGSELSGRDIGWIMSIRTKCWEVMSRREPLTTHDLDISGYDLMPLCSSGKEIGEAMEYLLDKVVDNPSLNHKEMLLKLLKNRT